MSTDSHPAAGSPAWRSSHGLARDPWRGRCPAWSRPTCSLIAPFVRRNDAQGKAAKHRSMVDASTANSLFLNRKPCRGARCWHRASRRPNSVS